MGLVSASRAYPWVSFEHQTPKYFCVEFSTIGFDIVSYSERFKGANSYCPLISLLPMRPQLLAQTFVMLFTNTEEKIAYFVSSPIS